MPDLERPVQGPARALSGSLRRGRCWTGQCGTGLLDGLAISIRLRLSSLSAGPDAMQVGVVFAGWPSAAIVPILSKSADRDKPQNRVRKSTRLRSEAHDAALAVLAGDETTGVNDAWANLAC